MANNSTENSSTFQDDNGNPQGFYENSHDNSQAIIEKPLSPVLSSSKWSRKMLNVRRKSKKFNRVKLADRFSVSNKNTKNNNEESKFNEFTEESFTVSQSDSLVKRLEQLEEIERNRQQVYKLLISKTSNIVIEDEFCFKKPTSPAPNKNKSKNSKNDLEILVQQNNLISNIEIKTQLQTRSAGFQTAAGTTISISDIALEKHSKIFDDILNPSKSENCRKSKYSFLEKKSYINVGSPKGFQDNLSIKDANNLVEFNHGSQNTFSDENEDLFPDDSRERNSSLESKTVEKRIDICLTQEIKESGISDSQIISAVDDVLNAIENKENVAINRNVRNIHFQGFNTKDLKDSTRISNFVNKLYSDCKFLLNIQEKDVLKPSLEDKEDQKQESVNLRIAGIDYCNGFSNDELEESKKILKCLRKSCRSLEKKVTNLLGKAQSYTKNYNKKPNAISQSLDNETKKHKPNDLFLPPQKRQKSKNYANNSGKISFDGFSSASGKPIVISEKSLQNAKNMLEGIGNESEKSPEKTPILQHLTSSDFSCASGKAITLSAKFLEKAQKTLDNIGIDDENNDTKSPTVLLKASKSFSGFACASGKAISLSEMAMKKAKSLFDSFENDDINLLKDLESSNFNALKEISNPNKRILKIVPNIDDVFQDNVLKTSKSFNGFASASGKPITMSEKSMKKAASLFENIDNEQMETSSVLKENPCKKSERKLNNLFQNNLKTSNSLNGFSSASGKAISISEKSLEKASNIFDNIDDIPETFQTKSACASSTNISTVEKSFDESPLKFPSGFQTASGNLVAISTETLRKSEKLFDSLEETNDNNEVKETKSFMDKNDSFTKQNKQKYSLNRINPKKRLGISSCKLIQISNNKLEKAKMVFDEIASPIQPNQNIFTSTPVRPSCKSFSTPNKSSDVSKLNKNFSSFMDSPITPINRSLDKNCKSIVESSDFIDNTITNSAIIFQQPTTADATLKDFEDEKRLLEERVKILSERLSILTSRLDDEATEERRPKIGVLLDKKKNQQRIALHEYVDYKKPGENVSDKIDRKTFEINPQNAETVHFNYNSAGQIAVVFEKTEDGAILVPNCKNTIGLTEIERSFKSMSGVDAKLIPKGWIKNHFKLIVWKLASYERTFPRKFSGCFSLENVVQQLKYRYDREIDRAERSALRKIFEKDDAPQKRMVLCVSNIIQTDGDKNELELTDGWYTIGTSIDEPLRAQVKRGKIVIGTKLIVCDAELLNCDGCHPLDATDLVRLRINFNCTRRAKWYTKLGYQPNPSPFPVQLQSVHGAGGVIGCVKIFISRVYPIRFMDRTNQTTWRNRKAEERKSQEWENERCKKLETVQDAVRKVFEAKEKETNLKNKNFNGVDVSEISCPKILFEMVQNCNDLYMQNRLSSTQQAAIQTYQETHNVQKQNEMRLKIEESMSKFKKRDVVPLLRTGVVDVNGATDKIHYFSIWKPTEQHSQILREGSIVTAYNVLPRLAGDLSSISKTKFKPENSDLFSTRFIKFRRKFLPIALLQSNAFSCGFDEFDTVGIVVQHQVEETYQKIWLTDFTSNLLSITIDLGPKKCLFDNISRGQTISVCNLVFRKCSNFGEATGSFDTVFSGYSQYKHLQDAMVGFNKELPKNIENLLMDCDKKVVSFAMMDKENTFNSTNKTCNVSENYEDINEDSTLVYTRITSTDVAMSMMDIDKLIN